MAARRAKSTKPQSAVNRPAARQWPLTILALLVVPALILEDRTTNPAIRTLCNVINWFVWLAFVGEFGTALAVTANRLKYVRSAWFDLAIILLSPPFLVPDVLQSTRSLRALRVLRLLRLMRGMAVATIGIGVISAFTATIASFFVGQDQSPTKLSGDLLAWKSAWTMCWRSCDARSRRVIWPSLLPLNLTAEDDGAWGHGCSTSTSADQIWRKCRLANSRPDPVFRYRSNSSADFSSSNSIITSVFHGRCSAVWGERPALCAINRATGSDVTPT